MAVNTNQNLSLRSVLEKDKLEENGNNYVDWIRSLGIVLKQERKLYILDGPVPPEPAANATKAEKDQHKKHVDDSIDVGCLMLASMCKALQKDLVHMEAYDLGNHLKEMFQLQARQERFDTMKALHSCKMIEGQPVGPHVLKMKGHLEHLERLGYPIQLELATDMILHSLPESYNQFVMNYNMNGMNKSLSELHGMLKNAENNIAKKTNQVLMVNKGKGFKKPKVKARVAKPEAKVDVVEKPQPKSQKDAVCYHCKETGHWRRNCKAYLEGLKKKGNEIAMTSGIYVIDILLSTSSSWVLDTGCGSHICLNVQGLKNRRLLKEGEVDLRVGNGARVAALAVGTYEVTLPSGLILVLNNCYKK